jgi:hypothetical protein
MVKSSLDMIQWARLRIRSQLGLLILICFYAVVCCVSLVKVAEYQSYILYDGDRRYDAIIVVAAFSAVSLLFVLARFSFGYFVGFYFYTMIFGFLWLGRFTKFHYDYNVAALSAAISMLLFLLPALLITAPVKQVFSLSITALERILTLVLILAVATIAAASAYNFKIISLDQIYDFRSDLNFPAIIRYLIGIVSSTLLPFAFACYLTLGYRWRAGAALLLLLLFYPITLSKFAFFAPAWIVTLLILTKIFECRTATILSLLLPMLIGVFLIVNYPGRNETLRYFGTVNIRMIATPSSAMDIYNDFFANHPLTYFCQISILKPLMNCPYRDPLSVVMEQTYQLGNLNASLFATEGIASVGLYFAPLAALVCGFVIGFTNRLSAGLPNRFVLISGALLPQAFVNVPFTTVLLSHGAGILFLLWYLTPRAMFEGNDKR